MPAPPVTARDVETYERDGVVCLRGVFAPRWLDVLAAGIEQDMRAPGPLHTIQQSATDPGFFLTDFCMAQRIPEFREFLFDSPAAEDAARVMGSRRSNFFYDAIWVKEPGTPKRTRWHQDQPFYPIDGRQMSVCWTPLDPVTKDTCLELIRGSHRWQRWFQPELTRTGRDLYAVDSPYERMPDIEADRSRFEEMHLDEFTELVGDAVLIALDDRSMRDRQSQRPFEQGDDRIPVRQPADGGSLGKGRDEAQRRMHRQQRASR